MKFKIGDRVRFVIYDQEDIDTLKNEGMDHTKSYRVVKVYSTILDIDAKNGDHWGGSWFELDKSYIVNQILSEL